MIQLVFDQSTVMAYLLRQRGVQLVDGLHQALNHTPLTKCQPKQ